jgi:hypothetical protein
MAVAGAQGLVEVRLRPRRPELLAPRTTALLEERYPAGIAAAGITGNAAARADRRETKGIFSSHCLQLSFVFLSEHNMNKGGDKRDEWPELAA